MLRIKKNFVSSILITTPILLLDFSIKIYIAMTSYIHPNNHNAYLAHSIDCIYTYSAHKAKIQAMHVVYYLY